MIAGRVLLTVSESLKPAGLDEGSGSAREDRLVSPWSPLHTPVFATLPAMPKPSGAPTKVRPLAVRRKAAAGTSDAFPVDETDADIPDEDADVGDSERRDGDKDRDDDRERLARLSALESAAALLPVSRKMRLLPWWQ
jgi:hypothetical protein